MNQGVETYPWKDNDNILIDIDKDCGLLELNSFNFW